MTDTQMVIVPKRGSYITLSNVEYKADYVLNAIIKASPNQGKVTKEMVDECGKDVTEVIVSGGNDIDVSAIALAVIKKLGLEVAG